MRIEVDVQFLFANTLIYKGFAIRFNKIITTVPVVFLYRIRP